MQASFCYCSASSTCVSAWIVLNCWIQASYFYRAKCSQRRKIVIWRFLQKGTRPKWFSPANEARSSCTERYITSISHQWQAGQFFCDVNLQLVSFMSCRNIQISVKCSEKVLLPITTVGTVRIKDVDSVPLEILQEHVTWNRKRRRVL